MTLSLSMEGASEPRRFDMSVEIGTRDLVYITFRSEQTQHKMNLMLMENIVLRFKH